MQTQHLKMILQFLYEIACFAVLIIFIRSGHPWWSIVPIMGLLISQLR